MESNIGDEFTSSRDMSVSLFSALGTSHELGLSQSNDQSFLEEESSIDEDETPLNQSKWKHELFDTQEIRYLWQI